MISIIRFRDTLNQRAKTGTSGYDSGPEFISKVNDSQTQLIKVLSANKERNQQIKDAIAPFVKSITKSTVAGTGLLAKESDYVHFGSVQSAQVDKPAYPINDNEVAIINSSPIRRPDISKGLIYYYQKDDKIYFLPKATAIPIEHTYIRQPLLAKLILVPVSNDDNDYLIPSTNPGDVVDLEWPESVFNLLLYMTMEKLGLEMKDSILLEYANLGIQQEQIDLQP